MDNHNNWISVHDKLPEIGKPVLVYSANLWRNGTDLHVEIAIYKGSYRVEMWENSIINEPTAIKHPLFYDVDFNTCRDYTHWMPIPEYPKEKEWEATS